MEIKNSGSYSREHKKVDINSFLSTYQITDIWCEERLSFINERTNFISDEENSIRYWIYLLRKNWFKDEHIETLCLIDICLM